MPSKTATTTRERIGRVGQRRQVVIPREIFEKLNMREGDFVAFAQKAGGVLVKPKRIVDADDTTLTPEEAKLVRRGMKQIKEGRFKLWRDVKHELGR
jgi:AbrB family looped-hinge helix DNA binding protein